MPLLTAQESRRGTLSGLSHRELAAAVGHGAGRERLAEVLQALNGPQRAVAERDFGPLLVVAGPGAGKTRAIVARAAHLIVARGVPPDEIAAITFSRRAAGELQARLAQAVGPVLPDGEAIWAGTFHALGAHLLRQGGAALFGRPRNFTIYDQDDTERALRRILEVLGADRRLAGRLTVAARQAISLAKRTGRPLEAALGEEGAGVPLDEAWRRYEDELRDAGAFDFDDLVVVTADALDRDSQLRALAQRRCRHLLVDEYQDTDPSQAALLARLVPPPHDLCVVADPQQSIYAFRGAAPSQVRQFVERWPGAEVVRLEQNYRSTRSIVAIARRLVAPYLASAEGGRFGLRLWTANAPGEPARLWVAPNPEKEAEAIAADVRRKLDAGWPPEEIAILVRTHAQARPIEAALLRAGVPYYLAGGVRFFAREEIKDLLAYLRLAVLPQDAAAFWRIVNTPRRGLGSAALLTIARFTVAGGGPLAGARRWAATDQAPDGLYDLLALLDELAAMQRAGAGPRLLLETALARTGYVEYVRRRQPDDAGTRLESLTELRRLAAQYDDARLFLDEAALASQEDDEMPAAGGRVRLSTVHAAKGLEFRAVYVPGCEQGLFPLATPEGDRPPAKREAGGGAGDAEERRIFYVAVTRAKEQLTLSYCTFRHDRRTVPSPYLAEIGRGLLRRTRLGGDEPLVPKVRKRPVAPTT